MLMSSSDTCLVGTKNSRAMSAAASLIDEGLATWVREEQPTDAPTSFKRLQLRRRFTFRSITHS